VEHDPMEIYSSQYAVMMELLTRYDVKAQDIAAIGITNQRETTILWDRATGRPVYNAIVWQCRRTADYCAGHREAGFENEIRSKTGLLLDPYFSATKIAWILDHVDGAREASGRLLFGTVDSWLLWRLSGGALHATDYTNASRTLLFNIHTLEWDPTLCEIFTVPMTMLPKVLPSSGFFAKTSILGAEVPVTGIAGDQQAALFGQCCFERGQAKNTYGTGCFLLFATGGEPVSSKNGLLTTIAAGPGLCYALEGSVFQGGAVIQWLRDGLRVIHDAADSGWYASRVEDSGGVYLTPAFTGLGAPYWDTQARGVITGLTRGTKLAHLIRAAEESIAWQSLDLIQAMERDTETRLSELRVDGGASRDDFLMQFQADILGVKVLRPVCTESTALGAAFLAGLGSGLYSDTKEVLSLSQIEREFTGKMDAALRESQREAWHEAVNRARSA